MSRGTVCHFWAAIKRHRNFICRKAISKKCINKNVFFFQIYDTRYFNQNTLLTFVNKWHLMNMYLSFYWTLNTWHVLYFKHQMWLRFQITILRGKMQPVPPPHPFEDVEAILQPAVLLPQLIQTTRRTRLLRVLQAFQLCGETLDLGLLEQSITTA